jgi:cytochrome c
MKRVLAVAVAGMAMGVFQATYAVDAQVALDEMKEHGCVKCHEIDKKKVGPSLKDVAAKYKGKSVEEAMAGMKSKPVHKPVIAKTQDTSLKTIIEFYLAQ